MPGMRRGKGGNGKPFSWFDAPPHPSHFGFGNDWELVPPRPDEPEAQYHRPPFGLPVTQEERAAHGDHGPGFYMSNGVVNNWICNDCGRITKGVHKGKRVPVFRRPHPNDPATWEKFSTAHAVTPEGVLHKNDEDLAETERQGYRHNFSGSVCPRCFNDWLDKENAQRQAQGKPPFTMERMSDDEDE